MWRSGRWSVGLVVGIGCVVLLLVSPLSAEPRYDLHGDLVAHGALEYEGTINQAPAFLVEDQSEMIIDDKVYRVRNDCILRNKNGSLVGITSFKPGMGVKFFALDELLITKLWQVVFDDEGDAPETGIGSPGAVPEESEIRLEDGVWKN